MKEASVDTIIANLDSLRDIVIDFRSETRETFNSMEKRLKDVEVKQGKQEEKLSAFSLFHGGLTLVVGAISAYLGKQ